MAERYPREAARTARRVDRLRAEHGLAEASEALAGVEADASRARDALAAHDANAPVHGLGRTTARDLQRAATHARAHAERLRELRAAVAQAEQAVDARRRDLERARVIFGGASAAEQVVERDRTRFETAARRLRERNEEAEADEVATLRHSRR